jgi:hypothetical protein
MHNYKKSHRELTETVPLRPLVSKTSWPLGSGSINFSIDPILLCHTVIDKKAHDFVLIKIPELVMSTYQMT